jgi:flagellar FliL protein
MAQNIKPAAQKPTDPTVPKQSSKKLLIGVIASLVLIIAAAAGWYFTKGNDHAPHAEEVKVVPAKPPIFVALEPFTVNLQRESNDQYLQMGITLKVFEADIEAKIKANLPEIRSKILQLLTTKTASGLVTAEGKQQLVKEILSISNSTIGIVDVPVRAAISDKPAKVDAASQVAESATETQPAQVAEAASAPAASHNHEVKAPVEKKGIVDVLFTSFIIQ